VDVSGSELTVPNVYHTLSKKRLMILVYWQGKGLTARFTIAWSSGDIYCLIVGIYLA